MQQIISVDLGDRFIIKKAICQKLISCCGW